MNFFTIASLLGALALSQTAEAAGLYTKKSPVVQVDIKNFNKLIRDGDKAAIVEFYAPWCGHCQNLKPAYEKAAKSLDGLAIVAAMNCDEEENKPICARQGIQGFPTLKTVRITGIRGRPIFQEYKGQRTAAAIVEGVKQLIPNTVKRVTDNDLDEWLAEKNESTKAILFSDKGTTGTLLKVLSNEYGPDVPFAQIRNKETAANEMFGIDEYPRLVVLPGGDAEPVLYEGKMDKKEMSKFLGNYAELYDLPKATSKHGKGSGGKAKKASKADSASFSKASASHASEDAKAKSASIEIELEDDPATSLSPDPQVEQATPVPVPAPEPVPELGTRAELESNCLGPKTQTCVLALLPLSDSNPEEVTELLESLGELMRKHNARGSHLFPFYAVPAKNGKGLELRRSLKLEPDGIEIVVVNGKRGWWKHFTNKDKGFGLAVIENWVDGIRLGEGKKEKLPSGMTGDEEEQAPVHEEL